MRGRELEFALGRGFELLNGHQFEAQGGGRVLAEAQFDAGMRGLEFFYGTVQVIQRAADLAVITDLGAVARRDGNADAFLVDVQAGEVDDFGHGYWVLAHAGFVVAAGKHGSDRAGESARDAHAPPATHVHAGSKHPLAPDAEP